MTEQSAMTKENAVRLASMDTGVLLFAITALAYAIAFAYEAGYFYHFGIPIVFADVSLKELLLCAAAAIGGISALAGVLNVVLLHWPQSLSPLVQRMLAGYFVFVGVFVGGLWLRGASLTHWLFAMIFPAIIGLFEFVFPIWASPKGLTYSEKVEDAVRADKSAGKGLGAVLARRFGIGVINAALGTVGVLLMAYSVGMHEARLQTEFLVPTAGPECAVMRVQSEGLLCADFDAKSLSIAQHYRYLPLLGTEVALRKIGNLRSLQSN